MSALNYHVELSCLHMTAVLRILALVQTRWNAHVTRRHVHAAAYLISALPVRAHKAAMHKVVFPDPLLSAESSSSLRPTTSTTPRPASGYVTDRPKPKDLPSDYPCVCACTRAHLHVHIWSLSPCAMPEQLVLKNKPGYVQACLTIPLKLGLSHMHCAS
jgi:hypothetical protein